LGSIFSFDILYIVCLLFNKKFTTTTICQRIVEVLKIYYYETKHAINTYLKTTSDSCK